MEVIEALEPLTDVAIPGTALGAAAWLFHRLFLRADRRETSLFREMRRQRDEWRTRAEAAEELLGECHRKLARVTADRGYDKQPRPRRNDGHRDAG